MSELVSPEALHRRKMLPQADGGFPAWQRAGLPVEPP